MKLSISRLPDAIQFIYLLLILIYILLGFIYTCLTLHKIYPGFTFGVLLTYSVVQKEMDEVEGLALFNWGHVTFVTHSSNYPHALIILFTMEE